MAVYRRVLVVMISMAMFFCAAPAFATEAKVVVCTGQVEYKGPMDKQWMPLAADTMLKENSQVMTHAGSSCVVRIGDSAAQLGPNAVAILTKTDPTQMDIKSGKIFVLVRNLAPGSEFRVVSPTAICAARGTNWAQSADEIQCYEGTVWLRGVDGSEAELSGGQGVLSGPSGLGTPRDLTDGEMNDAQQQADQLTEESGIPESTEDMIVSEKTIEMEEQGNSHDISPSA
jgi:hypothetical protein